MQNQINMGDQNTQPIGQNPINQQPKTQVIPKVNFWMISSIALVLIIVGLIGAYLYKSKSQRQISYVPQPTSRNNIETQPTLKPVMTEQQVTAKNSSNNKLGRFKARFSYPSEGIPVIRICFESKNDLSKQYCFFKPDGIGSKIRSTDVSEKLLEEGELPVGQYYVYIIVYWNDQPGDIINLNACNYKGKDRGSFPEKAVFCQEFDKQLEIRQKQYPGAGVWMSSFDRNIHFGGDREVFSIDPDKTLDLGTISVSPNT